MIAKPIVENLEKYGANNIQLDSSISYNTIVMIICCIILISMISFYVYKYLIKKSNIISEEHHYISEENHHILEEQHVH